MRGTFEILAEATLTNENIFLVCISFFVQFAFACLFVAIVSGRLVEKQYPIYVRLC